MTVPLYMVTGFLGSGKTTLVQNLIKLLPSGVRVIVNEFGVEGVDGALLREAGGGLCEITGGSVFCACRLAEFEEALDWAASCGPGAIVVETSGLSDPTGARSIVASERRRTKLDYRGCICVVDAPRFEKAFSTACPCKKQLYASSVVLINKTDMAGEEELRSLEKHLMELLPGAAVFTTVYGRLEPEWLQALVPYAACRADNAPDLTLQRATIRLKPTMTSVQLEHFVRLFAEDTCRVKGIAVLDEGAFLVNCVGTDVLVGPWRGPIPENPALNALSAGASDMRRSVREACKWYDGFIECVDSH